MRVRVAVVGAVVLSLLVGCGGGAVLLGMGRGDGSGRGRVSSWTIRRMMSSPLVRGCRALKQASGGSASACLRSVII